MGNIKIAIVTADSLLYLGIRYILADIPAVMTTHLRCANDIVNDNPDRYDVIITDAETCVSYSDYFLPRRHKTVVITSQDTGNSSFFSVDRCAAPSVIAERLIDYIDRLKDSVTSQSELSQREIDVLKLVASGKINKEIADELQISINTVLTHRKNITAKLGIRSVSGLSVYAMMNGYLTKL